MRLGVVILPSLTAGGEPETDMIGRYAAEIRPQSPDQVPKFKRPGRLAMHEHDRRTGTFVHVMQLMSSGVWKKRLSSGYISSDTQSGRMFPAGSFINLLIHDLQRRFACRRLRVLRPDFLFPSGAHGAFKHPAMANASHNGMSERVRCSASTRRWVARRFHRRRWLGCPQS